MKNIHHEVIVVGAGIAGLWTYHQLRSKGYDAILLERESIGGTQSLASQGMIHGGQRYALQGKSSSHSEGISEMPEIWNRSLKGEASPNLSAVKILSPNQIMWSPGGLTSNVTTFFASKAMNSRVETLEKKQWPEIFKNHPGFKGKIYEMDEVVLDIQSVTTALSLPYLKGIIKVGELELDGDETGIKSITATFMNGIREVLTADRYIFTAGVGNELVTGKVWPGEKVSQRRPLKQILVDDVDYALYGHCITVDPRPRVTVSAHPKSNGRFIWYLGGLVAVKHLESSDDEAIHFAKLELESLFPHVEWNKKRWSTLKVDRAEPYTSSGFLPEGPSILSKGNVSVAWPTKLTYAPGISNQILARLPSPRKNETQTVGLQSTVPPPSIGDYPWDHVGWKSVSEEGNKK